MAKKTESESATAAKELDNKDSAEKRKEKPKPPDGGWRETIESLAMAVILALLFKGYVAEAFVIPTGSMAPTLQGRHKDICCPQCSHWYQTTASEEVDRSGFLTGQHVISGTCPICRFVHTYNPRGNANEGSFSGDRIIVSKFAYEIAEPQRWDVIVFKYPAESTQNYIKRLVGLPGEHLVVAGGNVYVRPATDPPDSEVIARKPPHKLTAMLQIVDDTDHIPPALVKIGWPARWRETLQAENAKVAWSTDNGGKSFACKEVPAGMAWLRYRHLVPSYQDWESITLQNRLPPDVAQRRGQLITDLYAYNTSVYVNAPQEGWAPTPGVYELPNSPYRRVELQNVPARLKAGGGDELRYNPDLAGPGVPCADMNLGNHWVDDLAVECLAEVLDSQGTLALDLVRGGIHQRCTINIKDGQATLSRVNAAGYALPFVDEDFKDVPNPTATTAVKGAGTYRLRLTNCDHQVMLFVNGHVVKFDQPTLYESDEILTPQWNAQDGLDLEPAGVGVSGTRANISQLRIYRDKYYISNENQTTDYRTFPRESLHEIFASPDLWTSSRLFDPENRPQAHFELQGNEYFPMGDNSPSSSDGRYWPKDDYLTRDLLIGKALVIYWPHSWNRPMFLPHFQRMGRIR